MRTNPSTKNSNIASSIACAVENQEWDWIILLLSHDIGRAANPSATDHSELTALCLQWINSTQLSRKSSFRFPSKPRRRAKKKENKKKLTLAGWSRSKSNLCLKTFIFWPTKWTTNSGAGMTWVGVKNRRRSRVAYRRLSSQRNTF